MQFIYGKPDRGVSLDTALQGGLMRHQPWQKNPVFLSSHEMFYVVFYEMLYEMFYILLPLSMATTARDNCLAMFSHVLYILYIVQGIELLPLLLL